MPVPKNILVTGSNSQLAQCIADISQSHSAEFNFHFKSKAELDITKASEIKETFARTIFDYCINCAAYTAVDKAEEEQEKAYLINAEAVKHLAEACKSNNTILIHISTDFVFDGNKQEPYLESDQTNPLNVYGASKLRGEQHITENMNHYFIFRTSWLYSEFENNFVKTMVKLAQRNDELNIIHDQTGSPTYAGDLAQLIIRVIVEDFDVYGTYHFANQGKTSWYGFAQEIFKHSAVSVVLKPISSNAYSSSAKRPSFSVLSTQKLHNLMSINICSWQERLKDMILNSKR